jgi:alkanesulfonate monooxygenase SsuD/methylene tetrahydromethanopterin reductase-like flavin-dependent oxidoreductase (luciferase family)
MTEVVFAADEAALKAKIAERPDIADDPRRIVGTASQIVDKIGAFVEAGVERFMLQWLTLDDLDSVELIARDVLPQFHKA